MRPTEEAAKKAHAHGDTWRLNTTFVLDRSALPNFEDLDIAGIPLLSLCSLPNALPAWLADKVLDRLQFHFRDSDALPAEVVLTRDGANEFQAWVARHPDDWLSEPPWSK